MLVRCVFSRKPQSEKLKGENAFVTSYFGKRIHTAVGGDEIKMKTTCQSIVLECRAFGTSGQHAYPNGTFECCDWNCG